MSYPMLPPNLHPMSRYVRASYVSADSPATAAQAFPANALHASMALSILLASMYKSNLSLIVN